MPSKIIEIDNAIIAALTALGIFKRIIPAGRQAMPSALTYPTAYTVLESESIVRSGPRPVSTMTWAVYLIDKNIASAGAASRDVYAMLDNVLEALEGQTLGVAAIGPLQTISRELVDYDGGVITYMIKLSVRHHHPVPEV